MILRYSVLFRYFVRLLSFVHLLALKDRDRQPAAARFGRPQLRPLRSERRREERQSCYDRLRPPCLTPRGASLTSRQQKELDRDRQPEGALTHRLSLRLPCFTPRETNLTLRQRKEPPTKEWTLTPT